jgi:Na+/H+ antiporter NhaD/arsenite permease-like protein
VVSIGVDPVLMHQALRGGSAEIFELVVFLIGAMTIVEMMAHFRFFTWIKVQLLKLNITNKKLFWILGLITFFASVVLDNLTTTLIMIQIGRRLYIKQENFNIFVINTVIAANAGGAMSPVGDVTTIMIWLEQKFTAWQVLQFGFFPSLVAWIIPQAMLTRKIVIERREGKPSLEILPLQWNIIFLGVSTIGFAVLVNLVHLPPFMGNLFGLGVAAIVIDFRLKRGKLKKHENKIVNVIRSIDMALSSFSMESYLQCMRLHIREYLKLSPGLFLVQILHPIQKASSSAIAYLDWSPHS